MHLLFTCSTSSYGSLPFSVCLTNSSLGILGHVMKIISGYQYANDPLTGTLIVYLSINLKKKLNEQSSFLKSSIKTYFCPS